MADTSLPSTSPQPCGESLVLQDLLPDILYELLGVAINDARQFDRDRYFPISYWWHRPNDEGHCQVCLAGSTVARTFQCSPDRNYPPAEFPSRTHDKLEAINAMRNGRWPLAYLLLYGRRPSGSLEERLQALPQPAEHDFVGWHRFQVHLDSLEPIMYKLRRIELDTASS